jgi:glyoxylase I family protein
MRVNSAGVDLGIVVRDLDAMLAFYRDRLGLWEEGTNPVPGGGTMHRLWAGESMIKIVAPDPPPPVDGVPGGLRAATGLRYFTFTIEDLDATMAALETAGTPVVRPITEMAPGVRIALVEDPEGNVVEFLERA